MEKECGWCGHKFEYMELIVEYKDMYFCDEACLAWNLGAKDVVYKEGGIDE